MGVPCRNGETFSWVLQKVPLWLQRPWQGRSCACSQAPVTASPPHATPEGNASCDFIFFQFLPRNYLCATGAQQPDSVAAARLAQASRAHREDEGDEAPAGQARWPAGAEQFWQLLFVQYFANIIRWKGTCT